jgi:hypothetical protein
MPTAAELTPHLAAAMPKLAALVPWLLIWGATVVVLSLAGSILMVRGAARIKPRTMGAARPPAGAGVFGEAERRMARGRRLALIALAGVVGVWALTWLAGGPDPLLTELIFGVLVAGWLGPLYVAMRIFEGGMARAAARVRAQAGDPPSPSPPEGRGEGTS